MLVCLSDLLCSFGCPFVDLCVFVSVNLFVCVLYVLALMCVASVAAYDLFVFVIWLSLVVGCQLAFR